MRKLTFTEAEAQALSDERFHHPHPRVRRKMEALWLKSQELAHQDIARLVGVSGKTLRSYLQQYADGGIAGLKELHFRQPQSELLPHQEAITTYFRAHPPASINEAIDSIRNITGLSRSPTQVRLFLKEKCEMKRRKTGTLPAKADPDVQDAFKKKNSNRVWLKRKTASVPCSLSMRRTLSWAPLCRSCGALLGSGSVRLRVGSASTCWARWMP